MRKTGARRGGAERPGRGGGATQELLRGRERERGGGGERRGGEREKDRGEKERRANREKPWGPGGGGTEESQKRQSELD